MNNRTTVLRAFGMSAAQIVSSLQSQEREMGFQILPSDEMNARKLSGYEQFEEGIRKSASMMSEYYEIFYCLEVSIRQLVTRMLEDTEGPDWWNSSRIEANLKNEAKISRRKETDNGISSRSENNLDYLTFGQLGQVITSNFDLFETVLTSKSAVSRVMNQLNLLRNPIAHCCELAPDEADRLRLSVLDWFRLCS
jgi:hypothetical protein